MKPTIRASAPRFSAPTELKGDSPFLGATVQEWDDALTGNMHKSVAEVKRRAMDTAVKRDASKATSTDVASSFAARSSRK